MHHFQVLADADGQPASGQLPPACPFHTRSKVVRHGIYGTGATRRQRYRCVPDDGSSPHTFTPPLSREAVLAGRDACATCEEMLSPHRGTLTAARHTPWALATYARALSELSLGASYSSVSQWMRLQRETEQRHLAGDHTGANPFTIEVHPGASGRSISQVAAAGKTAWHLAGDLTEQYAPLLFSQVMGSVRARELRQRELNDAALRDHPEAPLAAPIVYALDDVPVYVKSRRHGQTRIWNILVVVELVWHPAPTPMDYPRHENRLRLARAYPKGNAQAWRLVLEELGTRPDFVIADCAAAIRIAVDQHYGSAVGFIPSLWHVRRALRSMLTDDRAAATSHVVEGRRTVVPSLGKRLALLDRDEIVQLGPAEWADWWDDLIEEVVVLGGPVEGLVAQRRIYQARVGAALPLLRRQPQLPASNAAVENRIRARLEPFLTNRKQLYRNLARTNALLDLATCREQGAFNDLDQVAATLREANEAAGGWGPRPRMVTDAQPAVPPSAAAASTSLRYSSLFNPRLVTALAESRLGGEA